jgi:RNAse (barnase) inhibitor barstar
MSWIDFRKELPGLRGLYVHAVNVSGESLTMSLLSLGFKVYTVEGSSILDQRTFFEGFARALEFPPYFGHNWDAWDECLGDFGDSLSTSRVAIVWKHADVLLNADIQAFLQAVCDLDRLANNLALVPELQPKKGTEPKQLEIFLLGEGSGFTIRPDLKPKS